MYNYYINNMKYSIDDNNKVAIFIRRLRNERNLSQQELADLAGVSFSFVNQVERGKETVRLDALNKLLLVLGYVMSPEKLDVVVVEPEKSNPVKARDNWLSFD